MNISKPKLSDSYQLLILLMGFFATTPIITVVVSGKDVAVFRILFYGLLFIMVIRSVLKGTISIGFNTFWFDVWLLMASISCVIGYLSLAANAPDFSNKALSYLPKTIAFLLFSLLWSNQDKNSLEKSNLCLLKGVLAGCIANLMWATVDGVGYYIFRKSINNIVFAGFIERNNIRFGMASLISSSGMIRASGFNYDPAHIGFIAPLIICYALCRKKYWLIIISLLGALTSASTTSIVSIIIIFVITLIVSKKKFQVRKNYKQVLIIAISIVASLLIIVFFGNKILGIINNLFDLFYSRVNRVYFGSDLVSNIRWLYIYYAPQAFINLGINTIFGLGFGTGSYGYITDVDILHIIGNENNFAYDPENTYIAYLFDTGLVGFGLFVFYISRLVKYNFTVIRREYSESELITFAGIVSTVLSMLFYHHILFTPQVLITIVGLTMMDSDRRKNDSYEHKGSSIEA